MRKSSVVLDDAMLRKICDGAAGRKFNHLKQNQSVFPPACESPIEAALFHALAAFWGDFVDGITFCTADTMEDFVRTAKEQFAGDCRYREAIAAPQVSVGKFRVDFMLGAKHYRDNELTLYAIECDGHDYHERTKEQAARDKSRDRELMSIGIKTIRFTGSEIWADPMRCADDVMRIVTQDGERDLREYIRESMA